MRVLGKLSAALAGGAAIPGAAPRGLPSSAQVYSSKAISVSKTWFSLIMERVISYSHVMESSSIWEDYVPLHVHPH